MVGKAVSSATGDEALASTVDCAFTWGGRTPKLVTAKSKVTNDGSFMCNSLLCRDSDFEIKIEDGGSNRPERNQDP